MCLVLEIWLRVGGWCFGLASAERCLCLRINDVQLSGAEETDRAVGKGAGWWIRAGSNEDFMAQG